MTEAASAGSTEDSVRFLLELGQALVVVGATAHRLEDALQQVAHGLGLQAQFFSTPTSLTASIGPPESARTSVVRVSAQDVDLGRLLALDRLAERVGVGELGATAAFAELQKLQQRRRPADRWLHLLAFVCVSPAAAVFFGGGLAEVLAAGVLGLLTGGLARLMNRRPAGTRLFEMVAAAAVTVGARALSVWIASAADVVTLASLIILIPGLTLTTGLSEVASRQLVSGSARLTSAAVVFLQMAFGVAAGARLFDLVFGAAPAITAAPLPAGFQVVAFVLAAAGFLLLFRVPLSEAPWVVIASGLGFLAVFFGERLGGPALASAMGAFAVGLAGQAYSRVLRRPSVLLIVPGILLLVPGSVGFRSFVLLLADDAVSGIQLAFVAVLTGMGIVAGLLTAQLALPSRRPL